MLTGGAIVFGIVLPIVISILVMLISQRPWRRTGALVRRGGDGRGQWGGCVAIGLSYLAAHVGIQGWPNVPPVPVEHAIFWIALAAMIYGAAVSLLSVGRLPDMIARVVLGLGAVWLVSRRMWSGDVERWSGREGLLWVILLGIGVLAFWSMLDALLREPERGQSGDPRSDGTEGSTPARWGFDSAFVLAGVVGLGGLLVTLNGTALALGELSGAVALSLLVCAGAALVRPGQSIGSGGTAVVALVATALWIDASLWADLEFGYAVALAVVPCAAFVGAHLVPTGAHNVVRTIARVAGVVIPIGLLVAIEIAKFVAEQAEMAGLGY